MSVGQHAIADFEALDAVPDFEHRTDVAIAQFHRLIELVEDRFHGGGESVGADFVEDHPHFFGLLPGLADPAGFGEIGQHPFGAGGNQRGPRLNQHAAGADGRTRHIGNLRDAVTQGL